jgi:hypothetical protein
LQEHVDDLAEDHKSDQDIMLKSRLAASVMLGDMTIQRDDVAKSPYCFERGTILIVVDRASGVSTLLRTLPV